MGARPPLHAGLGTSGCGDDCGSSRATGADDCLCEVLDGLTALDAVRRIEREDVRRVRWTGGLGDDRRVRRRRLFRHVDDDESDCDSESDRQDREGYVGRAGE